MHQAKKLILELLLFGVVLFGAANAIILSYNRYVFDSAASLPSHEIALVFGGGMKNETEMTDMQTDRVIRAVELYKSGKVQKIMMTGDDGARNGNEVGAMRNYALQAGVSAEDILVDPHGYRTYESCYREHEVYGLTSTIAISQKFHLSRIVYLCRRMGIETVGVTADLRDYGFSSYKMQIREALARLKALWQMEFTRPKPARLDK